MKHLPKVIALLCSISLIGAEPTTPPQKKSVDKEKAENRKTLKNIALSIGAITMVTLGIIFASSNTGKGKPHSS